jgi:uncharacterized membrane protein
LCDEKLEVHSNFAHFERIEVIVISNNITIMILEAMDNYGTLTNEDDIQVDFALNAMEM